VKPAKHPHIFPLPREILKTRKIHFAYLNFDLNSLPALLTGLKICKFFELFMKNRVSTSPTPSQWEALHTIFGARLKKDVTLAPYTAARLGGPADGLIVANSVDDLAAVVTSLWDMDISPFILGGGSNLLVSDAGVRGIVILNRAREIEVDKTKCIVWAGSGASFGQLARIVASQGYGGLEWAASIPGTVGGAVFGNAGAHGGDVAGNLRMAEILHPDGRREQWSVEHLEFSYRSSLLKQAGKRTIILAASFNLETSTPDFTRGLIAEFSAHRKRTQPPGASLGSMFKNPPGDYAGRLIEAAGLKGTRIGNAEISPLHANFFINHGHTKANDIYALIQLAQEIVFEKFGVHLELEIELVGRFNIQRLNIVDKVR